MLAPLMGFLQGITEFLPVSSSGHLRVFALLFSEEPVPFVFDIILHIATLFAVLFFTRTIVWSLIQSLFHFFSGKADSNCKKDMQIIGMIVISTFFTAPVAFYIKFAVFDSTWFIEHERLMIGGSFLLTAIILILPNIYFYFVNRYNRVQPVRDSTASLYFSNNYSQKENTTYSIGSITMQIAIIVGIVQGFAALPGISRSGITISVALLLGAKKHDAMYFSFLISIPTILASFLFSLDELQEVGTVFSLWYILIGMITAFVSGLLMLYTLRYIVKKGILWIFSLYLIPLSFFLLFYM